MEQQPSTDEYRQQRLQNLSTLSGLGLGSYGHAWERTGDLQSLRDGYEEGREVRAAGRLVARREMGKSVFAHLQDGSGRFQVYLKRDVLGDDLFKAFKAVDLGDHVAVEGTLFTTRTEEMTINVGRWELMAKALLPLPEKWHGLQDVEARYRQRYLDLVANPEVMTVFRQRIDAIRAIRGFLADRGFLEVETPMMQAMAGGAAAQPFRTHFEALGVDMFLRIAPELYLKRLLVGGFDKVFELNRNFRNEGLSKNHNPEFSMLEVYEAYGDCRSMMRLVEDLVTEVSRAVFGGLQVGPDERPIDLTPPWRRVTYHELVRGDAGDDWFDLDVDAARARARELGLEVTDDGSFLEITQEVFEKRIERNLHQPTFVTRLPAELVPLAKTCEDDPAVVDVFELIIGGREIAPGYSELNDPQEQRARFLEQAGGDASKVDEEFLAALEHGMPPAGGMGIGIDRLMMVYTGVEAIRDVILFPQLRPREGRGQA